jgi:putative transposase
VQHYLWRAVDQHHVVLDILVQARRDAQAATRLFKRLLMGLQYELQVIVTDKLRSYDVAQRQLLSWRRAPAEPIFERAETSHRPTRRRERQMQRFKSSRQAQHFLSAHSFISGHFRPRRHQLTACAYRESGPTPSVFGTRKLAPDRRIVASSQRPSRTCITL